MRRLALVTCIALLVAGCGGSKHAAPKPVKPLADGSIALDGLPAEGVVGVARNAVVFVGLDGKVAETLPGFAFYPRNQTTADLKISAALDGLGRGDIRLVHGHRWYRFDAAHRRLVPLREPRLPLPGGSVLVPHLVVDKSGGVGLDGYSVEHGRIVVVPTDKSLRLVAGRYVQSRGTVIDLSTNDHRVVPPGCLALELRGPTVYADCQRKSVARLVAVRPDASQRVLATLKGMYLEDGAVSGNGRTIAVHGSPGCGAGYTFLVPTTGGKARLVSGGCVTTEHTPFSTLLGWAHDGRLVAAIETPACDGKIKSGVYLVDPKTLKRTYVTASGWAMWSR